MAYEEKEYAKSFDIKVWLKLMPFMKPYHKLFVGVLVFISLCAVGDIMFPLMQRYAIDSFIETGSTDGIGGFAIAYVILIVLQSVFVLLFTMWSMRIEMSLGRDIKRSLFNHLQTLSLSYYNVTPVGYILARVMNDTNRIAGLIAWNLPDILWAFFYVFGVFGAMLMLDVKLALLVIVVVPVIAVLTWYFQNRILHWNRLVRKNNSRITGAFNEGIMGARTSKTLVIEEQNLEDFDKLTGEMHRSGVRAAQLSAIYIPLVVFVSSVAVAVVMSRGGLLVHEGLLQLGVLSAFTAFALGIFEPIQQLARNLADFISMQANIERVMGLLEEQPLVTDTPEVVDKYGDSFTPRRDNWEPINGDITFEDVSFHYPDGGDDVLSHFDLHVPAGTTVAIVGETGAGKSTLINLACRFFEPTGGRILIDGVDYRERSQLWLHQSIGYVLQSPHLFSGSVMDNIRYGRLEATDDEVMAAARAVSADTVVDKLELGYNSPVGEGGDHLSTGEKQLISFARAVLANPRIFVLDEATSSIDTETEQLIQHAIAHLLRGRTSFLIAHRLSTIRHADMILVVRDGHIVDKGTHHELLEKHGYYYDLYSKQFAEESAMQLLG